MLTDELMSVVKQMKKLDVFENAVQDAEKKQKNDSDFSELVNDFSSSMDKIGFAVDNLDYTISEDTIAETRMAIEKLENVISSGGVDEVELASAKQHINRKVVPNFSKEWKNYHSKKVSGLSAKLDSMGGLIQDKEKLTKISDNLNNSKDWVNLGEKDQHGSTRIELLKQSVDEVNRIEESLNLSENVRNFVVLVTSGRAKITDLSDEILEWISKENMQDKFVISFKK